ncbi:MAG: hypothetical protein QG671_2416 [Actinomycetota bacterium]|nr:hypothetical protein [Actinomycetota bacterium]
MSYTEWRQHWPRFIVAKDTETAVIHLKRYYSEDDDGQPNYTGSRFESVAALNLDPDTLGPADFLAVSMLSVKVRAQAALRLMGRDAAEISRLLAKIPADVDIVDADPALLRGDSPAGQLWALLRRGRDGLGRTTTSKLLAAKRPRLLPIWDSFVEDATGLDTNGNWEKFRYVLTDDDRAVWDWLSGLRAEVPAVPSTVSELRILDVLLWMSVEAPLPEPLAS